jgi:cytoskeleton protein RodZ
MIKPPTTETGSLPLGEFLRQVRVQHGLELDDVALSTRISPRNLQAMEESDYITLPAEVFTRGFYSLYAKCLALDQQEVLALYDRERKDYPQKNHFKTPPPYRLAENMRSLADRPSPLPFAYFGLVLLLLLFLGAFLCWYFSWNPATYLSLQLRSLDPSFQSEAMTSPTGVPLGTIARPEDIPPILDTRTVPPRILNLPSPTIATAATTEQRQSADFLPTSGATRYHVNAIFTKHTKVALTIDDHPTRSLTFREGEQVSWRAVERLIVNMPSSGGVKVVLNGIAIDLPPPENEEITLAIPESLLR